MLAHHWSLGPKAHRRTKEACTMALVILLLQVYYLGTDFSASKNTLPQSNITSVTAALLVRCQGQGTAGGVNNQQDVLVQGVEDPVLLVAGETVPPPLLGHDCLPITAACLGSGSPAPFFSSSAPGSLSIFSCSMFYSMRTSWLTS